MDKCQQFIDKVSELRFPKIKERQVNKFNRLLLKKQGNITWFSAVPPTQVGNPHADSAGPQVASTPPPQAGSSQACSTVAQAASTSSPKTGSSQAVSTNSQGDSAVPPQAGSPHSETTGSQAASTSQTGNSQAECTDVQATSASPKAVSTIFQGDSTAPHRQLALALTPREIVLFHLRQIVPRQRVPMPRQPAPLLKQSTLTPRELVLLPRLPRQVDRQIVLTIPRGLPEASHWKTPIQNGLSIYLVNLWPRLKIQYWLKALTLWFPQASS